MLRLFGVKRGDTLIEVLFAVTIFSLVAVGGLSIMNQGTATSQRALEITLVRQQIDAQAEALRFMHASYVNVYKNGATYAPTTPAGQWALMVASINATNTINASNFGAGSTCPTAPTGSFVINTRRATFVAPSPTLVQPSATFSQVVYNTVNNQVVRSEGLWIEAVYADRPSPNVGFTDFHIRACWTSLGQTIPVTLGTIVRLYEPRG